MDASAFVGNPPTNFEWMMPIAMGHTHSLCALQDRVSFSVICSLQKEEEWQDKRADDRGMY